MVDEPAYANLRLKHHVKMLTRRLAEGLMFGLSGGLLFGLTLGLVSTSEAELNVVLAGGLAGGPMFGLAFGFIEWAGTPSRTDWASTPRSTHKATRTLTVLQISLFGLAGGLAGWLSGGLALGAVGLVGGPVFISRGAWLNYVLAVCRLAVSGRLPLRLMDFLDDAYRLGLLRTVGPAYQFRHAEFHDYIIRTTAQKQQLSSYFSARTESKTRS